MTFLEKFFRCSILQWLCRARSLLYFPSYRISMSLHYPAKLLLRTCSTCSKKERIVLREIHLRTTGRHLSMGSHTSATRQRWPPSLNPNRAGWYSIYQPHKDGRLSGPSWLVTYRNGLPVHRQSPIRVLLLLVCVSFTIIGQPRNSVLIRRV